MQVYHEEFGEGQILASTEQFDEAGNITTADVMFEHGVEMGISADDLQELSKETMGSYVKAKKAAIPYQATAPGIKLAQKKMAKNEEAELDEGKSKSTLEKHFSGDPQVMFTTPGKPKPAFTEPKSKSMKEEKQHIEVIDASGQKRKVPVDADKAFAAVAHYRKQPGIKSARIVSETVEVEEAVEVETIKHPIGQRPKGPGWVLKSAGEQTGKDHNVWQRKFKQVGEAAEVCTLGKESTGKTATTVAPTKKFGKPKPTAKGEVAEELTAAQKKHIDKNKNGKVDADDFEKLRGEDEPPFDKPYHASKGAPSKSHRQKLARSGIPEETMTEETKDTPHNVTPASADLRNVAVENTVRQIMAQNIDLRQEAKERDFNSRNNK